LQAFGDNGVRPVLRGRIKSNQMPKWDPRYCSKVTNEALVFGYREGNRLVTAL
jgi:hypothetical protein